jgi:beta-hydroxylase
MTAYIPSAGIIAFAIFVISGMYVHFRGRVRHKPLRQMSDHSTFMAPVNCLIYLFSKLPATPYHSVEVFPELKLLSDNWQAIREEALALDAKQQIVANASYEDAGFNSFFRTGWRRFQLKWYGTDLISARKLCPYTTALLDKIPSVKAAMFASLPPGAKLVAHRDPYAGSMRYHLGLQVPEDPRCAIYVDGQPYVWKNGEGVIFDETYIHYAENKTDQGRIVLFCDVRRPLWFAPVRWVERIFARVVMGAAVSRNTEEDKIGLVNQLFSKVYFIREIGKSIKKKNRPIYYLLKFIILGSLVYWIFF